MTNDHPLLLKLKSICESYNVNAGKAILAFELYMELCEIQKLWEINYYFNERLKIFYLTGKVKKSSEECNIYVPVTTDENFSVEYLQILQETLSPKDNSLILVFKDRDSSSTHYRITNRLIRPDSPGTSQRKKIQDKNYVQFQKCLTNWRKVYFNNAVENVELSLT